jgi:hypothetical protein
MSDFENRFAKAVVDNAFRDDGPFFDLSAHPELESLWKKWCDEKSDGNVFDEAMRRAGEMIASGEIGRKIPPMPNDIWDDGLEDEANPRT